MKKRCLKGFLVVFLLMGGLLNLQALPGAAASYEVNWGDFLEFVEEMRSEGDIPGASVAVVTGTEILLAEGLGVRSLDTEEPVTRDTLFAIGSTQKSMTSMLIASLVDDGFCDWDTPASEISADFVTSDSTSTQEITLRHLLSMSSGIPEEAEDEIIDQIETAEDIFSVLPNIELDGEPGEVFSYSNVSASLAGYLGVIAAGEDEGGLYEGYTRLLQNRIFNPIGMDSALLSVEDYQANPNHCDPHEGSGRRVLVVDSYDFTGDPLSPSGSVKADILDLAVYVQTQIRRGLAPNGKRVVSESNLMETWKGQIEDGDGDYALCWGSKEEEGVEIVWHEGSWDGCNSLLLFFPDVEIGLALLTNLDDSDDFLESVPEEFVTMILDSL